MNQIPNIEEEKGMELILEVLPHLILGNAEELYNNPDGEMAKNTISEMQRVIRETHHQQLQKARQDWLRSEIEKFEVTQREHFCTLENGNDYDHGAWDVYDSIITRYKEELLELEKGV